MKEFHSRDLQVTFSRWNTGQVNKHLQLLQTFLIWKKRNFKIKLIKYKKKNIINKNLQLTFFSYLWFKWKQQDHRIKYMY